MKKKSYLVIYILLTKDGFEVVVIVSEGSFPHVCTTNGVIKGFGLE